MRFVDRDNEIKRLEKTYATNSEGTSYGSVESFTTEDKPSTGEINGRINNIY